MSHLILKTTLTPDQLLSQFQQLKLSYPAFIRGWIAPNPHEILLEFRWHANSEVRTEYLSIQQREADQLILHMLIGSERIPKALLKELLQKLWHWWSGLDPQAQIVRHTLGSHVDISSAPFH